MKQRTREETIAECYRLVAEQEAKLPPYQYALFLQRLNRKLDARILERSSRVDGDCLVIEPAKFMGREQTPGVGQKKKRRNV
jgi:hypothetical protein